MIAVQAQQLWQKRATICPPASVSHSRQKERYIAQALRAVRMRCQVQYVALRSATAYAQRSMPDLQVAVIFFPALLGAVCLAWRHEGASKSLND